MNDRIGAVVEINGRRLTVTAEGCRFATMKKPELRTLALTAEQLDGLQAAVRANLGRCASLQTQDGLPCMLWPKGGAVLCPKHGGRIPTHLSRGERLLAAIRLPALEWLASEIDRASEDTCETCGYPSHGLKERKHIASLVWRLLDRAGLPPTKKLEVETKAEKDLTLDGWTAEEKVELGSYLRQAKILKARVEERLLTEEASKRLAIPAELVPQKLLDAQRGILGSRPAEGDLDPIDD